MYKPGVGKKSLTGSEADSPTKNNSDGNLALPGVARGNSYRPVNEPRMIEIRIFGISLEIYISSHK